MDLAKCFVSVVDVEQHPIRENLNFLRKGAEFVVPTFVALDTKTQLQHFTGRMFGDQLPWRTFGHDVTFIHHDQTITQLFGLIHVVRRDNERDAFALEAVEALPEQVPSLWIKPSRRLVQDE